jgi:hypothetical protein
MIVQPELETLDILERAFAAIRAEPYVLLEVFGTRPPDEQQEITTYFSQNPITVHPAYPRDPTELPGCYVNLGNSSEAEQPIGMFGTNEKVSAESWVETEIAFFRSMVRVLCAAADNTRLPIWLGEIARWALVGARSHLSERGLLDQLIQMSDFEPMQQWAPTLVFRRDVLLTTKTLLTVPRTFPALREITATGEVDQTQTTSTYSVTLRD